MSKDDLPPACRQQRFKGVESFLRRLAFNLGNTPSQTEVKIISCIPIDVTDLQQKIISLEKELYETKGKGSVNPPTIKPIEKNSDSPAVNISSALYGSAVGKPSTTVSHCNVNPETIRSQRTLPHFCDCLTIQDKSNVSFAYPAYSTHGTEQTCRFASAENSNTIDSKTKFMNAECCRNIFKKRKRKKIFKDKLKAKTQLVYYAQTPNNPFNHEIPQKDGTSNKLNVLSHSYLEDVFRKHHDPKLIVEEFSDTSHFSKPICRDTTPNWRQRCTNASDVCSCCHGTFQNVDNYMDRSVSFEPNKTNQLIHQNNKFDDPYDMIPVKEKSIKHKETESLPKFENYVNMKCWPEKIRTKYRYHPFIVNYEVEMPIKRKTVKNKQYNRTYKTPTHPKIKREIILKTNQGTGIETSKSCCIDCGDIYKKPVISEKAKSFLYKNECVATDIVNTDFHDMSALNNQTDSSVVDKTEVTLSQIKNILQSVLAEVKTNCNINNVAEEIVKKDAIIQKGTSQNTMQGASTLLHSFTYNNSYNANPYLASCSRQIPSGQYCYPGMPCDHGKYLQNFPVFIQHAPGRHMCACYYRSSAHKTSHSKRATTAGTNTDKDIRESSSKETEKLIKEIYKSMALNMDYPNKDNSVTEYDDFKSTDNTSMTSDAKGLADNSVRAAKNDKVDVIISPLVSNTTESKLVYTAMSSQTVSQKTEMVKKDQSIDTEFDEGRTFHRLEETDEVDTEESSSSVESDYTVVAQNENAKTKKEKTGFLQKVFKSVFKKKKEKKIESEADKSAASDSDDYETVYSEKVNKSLMYPRNKRSRPTYTRPPANANYVAIKRKPYMEQEYRRQWNENLTFRDNQNSRRPHSRPLTGRGHYNQPYWQEYEARSAMVEPIPSYYRTVPPTDKVDQGTDIDDQVVEENIPMAKKNVWLKKHRLGIHCGHQWKKLILDN